jgi:hypothetical protein
MKCDYKPQHVLHKHGGTITAIKAISHEIAKPKDGRSQDIWFFVGDVAWDDGSKSKDVEIAPWALCHKGGFSSEGHHEISDLMKAMNDYLAANGTWVEAPSTKHVGWYATDRKRAA